VHASAQHLLALANDLLDLARTESGRISVAMDDVDVAALLDGMLESFRARADRRRVGLAARWETDAPLSVRTDPTRLREILTNLLDNAVRHTEAGEVLVTAGADAQRGTLTLRVCDTGPGIAPERLSRLFEAGGGCEPGEVTHGAGLGLAITRHLTAALGGELAVSSVVGQGTVFTLRLQVAPIREAVRPWPAERGAALAYAALVVDDACEVREFMRARLGPEGVRVAGAGSCDEALATVRAGAVFDLVLLDLHLAGASGRECLAALRPLLPGAAFVAFTGDAGPGARARCLAHGFDGYLAKPFREDELAAVLALLGERRTRAAG